MNHDPEERLPRRSARVLGIMLIPLTACGTIGGSVDDPSSSKRELDEVIRDHGMRARQLYSGHRGAGTILVSDDGDDSFMTADELGIRASLEPAAFLEHWTVESSVDNSLNLSFLGVADEDERVKLGAKLRDAGVTSFSVRLGRAWEESVSVSALLEHLDSGGSRTARARNAVMNGQPFVNRALRVDSLVIELTASSKSGGGLDIGLLSDLLSVDVKAATATKGGVLIKVDNPVYVGYSAIPAIEPPEPPPRHADQIEPNDDFSSATPMRPNGTARGALAQPDDSVDTWVMVPDDDGIVTISCRTTSGVKKATVRSVVAFDASGHRLTGATRPYLPGKTVSVGSFPVTKGKRYYVQVKPKSKAGSYAEYSLESSFAKQ